MICLIIPYYSELNIIRKRELDQCLANNICNKKIGKIVLVCDETVPTNIKFDFDKVEMCYWGKRPTFSDMFYRIAPRYTDEGDVKIFANSDIYFDDSISLLNNIDWSRDIALCLQRWDKDKDGNYGIYDVPDSQDVWCFKGEIKGFYCEFPLGICGCDNRIMYELDRAGYWVFNPAKDIKCYHLHDSGIRNYLNEKGEVTSRVPDPYKTMYAHTLDMVKQKKVVKIAHIGMHPFFAEGAAGEILQEAGEYQFINWMDYADNYKLIPSKRQKFEHKVLQMTAWADIVYMQLQTPDIISVPLAQQMSKYGKKIINFTGDLRDPIPQEFIDLAPYCTTVFTNMNDVETMRGLGFKSEFMQVIFSPTKYNPKGMVDKNAPEIVFMANNYYNTKDGHIFPLGKARQDLTLFLIENYGNRFGVYGSGWDGLERANYSMDYIREAAIYRGAKIGINYSHFNYSRYSSDRLFRMMGCGCFCISHNYKDIEKDFEIGKHLVVFDTLDELKEKIYYYLTHEEERNKIAKAGMEYVHRTAKVGNFFSKIMELK